MNRRLAGTGDGLDDMQKRKFCYLQAQNKGRIAGQLPGAPTYKERYDVTGMIRSIVLANSGVHARKKFFEYFSKFGHAASKIFASPVLGR